MTQNAYDVVPYASHAFPQSQPEQLAVMARLFGLSPALPSRARVLELGCSAGGNLVPLGARYPDARFVGIDASAVQVADGRRIVDAMTLPNVEIRHQSITEFADEGAPFDYVVCHGVYSWVVPDVQARILALCRQHLAPDGVAYVSYNTYPGWKMREIVRDAMLYHTRGLVEPKQRLEQARAIVRFVQETSDPQTAFGRMLADEAALIGRSQDFYLFHEHLEANNRPCYFREFVERAAAAGLGYLGEAQLADMAPQRLGAKVYGTLREIARGDVVATEQYMDFLRNRSFRQTLLVHGERLGAVRRDLHAGLVRNFLLSFDATPVGGAGHGPASAEPLEFRDGAGRSVRVVAPLLKAFLLALVRRFPRPAAWGDVADEARAALEGRLLVAESDLGSLDDALLRFVVEGIVRLHLEALPTGTAADPRPRSFGPARLAAQRRETTVATLRHESIRLTPVETRVLELLDGSRDRDALREQLVGAAVRGEITVRHGEQPIVDPKVLLAAVGQLIDDSLQRFERLGLLAA